MQKFVAADGSVQALGYLTMDEVGRQSEGGVATT